MIEIATERLGAVKLPPADLVPVEAIREAIAAFEASVTTYREADAAVVKLDRERAKAEQADREAYAAALRKGRKDPGQANVEAFEEQLSAATRHRDARRLIAEQDLAALQAALDEHEDELTSAVDAARRRALDAWTERLDALADAKADLLGAMSLARFVASGKYQAPTPAAGVVRVGERHDTTSVDSLLDTLRSFGAPPVSTPPVQGQLRAVEDIVAA